MNFAHVVQAAPRVDRPTRTDDRRAFSLPPSEPERRRQRPVDSRPSARVAAVLALAITLPTLLGWLFGIEPLTRPLVGNAAMSANTALALALLGGAVALFAAPGSTVAHAATAKLTIGDRFALAMVLAAIAIGALTAIEYIVGVDLGIDGVIADSVPNASRPHEVTTTLILLCGVAAALTVRHRKRTTVLRQAMLAVVMLTSLVAILAYAYAADIFFDVQSQSAVALRTAVAFLLLELGILLLRPRDGWMSVVTGAGPGSVVLRLMLPAIVIGVPLVASARLLAETAGSLDPRHGSALFATVMVAILFTASVLLAAHLNRQDDERILAEADRRRLEALIDGLVENSASVIVIQDIRGHFLLVNEAFEKWRSSSRDEVIGRSMFDVFPQKYAARLEAIRHRVTAERAVVSEEIAAETNGRERTFLAQIFPIVDHSGRLLATGTIATDITQRKTGEQLTQKLNLDLEREAERARDAIVELEQFAHTVSHDLRSPLRAIDGFTQVLEAQYDSALDDRGKRYLSLVRAGVKEMGDLISGLLEFSRLGRAELKLGELDMTEIAIHANELLAFERDGRQVHVQIDQLPGARGDQQLIAAVFTNLLSNAHKYTRVREDAEIHIGSIAAQPGRPVTYFVSDNGIGFEMQYAEKLFGVFERLHHSEDYEGSGVGLATVQRIIRRHGGAIWAESEPDSGTTILFQLKRTEQSGE